ncbi:MAG: hypothetical protein U0183_03940 [Polyangiaceae bacterium]
MALGAPPAVSVRRHARGLATRGFVAIAVCALVGCGGGAPLLHPARTLPSGEVRVAGGLSGNFVPGGLASDLRAAREQAATSPQAVPGGPGENPAYARGALVAAAMAPGIAPFVGARVGLGSAFEGGLAYTGRAVRVDVRKSFDTKDTSLSIGIGGSAALYGRDGGQNELPGLDLGALKGYGADVPLLVGWQSQGGLYRVWGGARGGFERDSVGRLSSEPRDPVPGAPLTLDATRFYAGGVFGLATGLRHVHVALELQVAYQTASGTFNGSSVSVSGLSVSPATALLWSF